MEGLYWTLPIYRKTKYTNSAYPSLFGTPTNTVLAADGYNPQNGGDSTCLQVTSTGGFALPQFRHGNLGNFVFIDGHVTSMNPDELAPAGGQSQKYFVFAPQTFWRPFNHKYYDRNGALINL